MAINMLYPLTVSYSIKALSHLAGFNNDSYIKVKDIARDLNMPKHFLGKILSQLVKKKLLMSTKGPTGGVRLRVAPNKVTLFDIFEALDVQGTLDDSCVFGLEQCSDKNACPFHKESDKFKKRILSVAKKTTISDLTKK